MYSHGSHKWGLLVRFVIMQVYLVMAVLQDVPQQIEVKEIVSILVCFFSRVLFSCLGPFF